MKITPEVQAQIDSFDKLSDEIMVALMKMKKLYNAPGFRRMAVHIKRPHNSDGQEICIPTSFSGYTEMLPVLTEV